jgi:hypothetical protein
MLLAQGSSDVNDDPCISVLLTTERDEADASLQLSSKRPRRDETDADSMIHVSRRERSILLTTFR